MSKPLNKAIIVESAHNQLGISKKKCSKLTETLLEIIKSTLASGEDVLITGFGKFNIKNKRERKGRNPETGEDMMLPSRKIVTFKCSGRLRDRVNGGWVVFYDTDYMHGNIGFQGSCKLCCQSGYH
jgi:integration host factor subunit alpha